jgi:hypothetical protein
MAECRNGVWASRGKSCLDDAKPEAAAVLHEIEGLGTSAAGTRSDRESGRGAAEVA